jgi:hypothetical protein
MRNIDRISDAIADLDAQEVPNVKATAEKYEVNRKTLENQWKGKSVSMQEALLLKSMRSIARLLKINGRENQSQCKRQSLPIASASPTLKRRLL